MSNSRTLILRKSANVNPEQIMFPFMFLSSQFGFSIESIIRKIYSSPDIHIDNESTFPHNIQEYFWIREGKQGKEPWLAFGILNDGVYFFYSAYMIMPTNTFINNGHMNLWLSIRFSDILMFAMDSSIYSLYLANTDKTIE